MKLLFKKQYREFFMPGDVGDQDEEKARELINLGYAEPVSVEEKAPLNKEVVTGKTSPTCNICGRGFASPRGVKAHKARTH